MTRFALALGLIFLTAAAATAGLPERKSSVLVIGLPGVPNPPTRDRYAGELFRGTLRWADQKGRPAWVDPVRALTQAALGCGQRRFRWRGLNYDHGNELLIADNPASRRALTCIAGKVSFDFYARVERIEVR